MFTDIRTILQVNANICIYLSVLSLDMFGRRKYIVSCRGASQLGGSPLGIPLWVIRTKESPGSPMLVIYYLMSVPFFHELIHNIYYSLVLPTKYFAHA